MSYSPGLGEGDSRVPLLCPLKHGEVPLTVKPWSQKEKEPEGQKRWCHQRSKEPATRKVGKEYKEGSPGLPMKPPSFLVSYFHTPGNIGLLATTLLIGEEAPPNCP